MRQQDQKTATERVFPIRKGGLNVEPADAVVSRRHRYAVESDLRVPDLLAVERHLDRMCRRRAYRPALENDAAGGRQRDLVTMVMEGALVRGRRRRRKLRYLDLGRDLAPDPGAGDGADQDR